MNNRFYDALSKVHDDGRRLYLIDRDSAFQWYSQQRFPEHGDSTIGIEIYLGLAEMADLKAIWKEAWAGFHKVLAGALARKEEKRVAVSTWRIGRAHMGLGMHESAALYLDTAQQIIAWDQDVVLRRDVFLDSAVLGKMTKDSHRFDVAMAKLTYTGSSTEGLDLLELNLLSERIQVQANKNSKWADEAGQWVPGAMRLALAQLEVSLVLNRKAGHQIPVGFLLSNMADVQERLGEISQARELYTQSLLILTQCGQQDAVRVVRERLGKLQ